MNALLRSSNALTEIHKQSTTIYQALGKSATTAALIAKVTRNPLKDWR
jgi:hypothetical protein